MNRRPEIIRWNARTRTRRTLLAGSLILAMLVAACGGASEDEAAPGSETPADQSPPAESADNGDVELVDFIWVGPGLPTTVDPVETGVLPNSLGVERLSRPVSFDPSGLAGGGCDEMVSEGQLRGELAESWTTSDDRRTITIKFREGVLSPFGNELTSDDAKWSMDRAIELSSTAASMLQRVSLWASKHHPSGDFEESPISIVDDYTIEIAVAEPGSLDVMFLNMIRWMIHDTTEVLQHATDDDPWAEEWLRENSANFGPWHFTADDWQSGEQLTMTRNPNYFAPEEFGNIGRFIMRAIPDGTTRAQLLATGEVDYAVGLAASDAQQIEAEGSGQVLYCVAPTRDTLLLNHADPKFADVRVRQAISLALDRADIAQAAYLGAADPATDGMNQHFDFDPPSDPELRYRHDVDRARELLAEAGYPDGFSMTLPFCLCRPGPQSEQIAVMIQSQLSEVGIDVDLQLVASGTEFATMFQEGEYEALVYSHSPALAGPTHASLIYNHSLARQNSFGYFNERYDELADLIRSTALDDPARRQYIQDISAHIVETVPKIYLIDTRLQRAFSSSVDVSRYEHHPYNTTIIAHRLAKH